MSKRGKRIGTCDGRYGVYIRRLDEVPGRWEFWIGRGGLMGCGVGYTTEEAVRTAALDMAQRLEGKLATIRYAFLHSTSKEETTSA